MVKRAVNLCRAIITVGGVKTKRRGLKTRKTAKGFQIEEKLFIKVPSRLIKRLREKELEGLMMWARERNTKEDERGEATKEISGPKGYEGDLRASNCDLVLIQEKTSY
ncbi:hypothetical protein Salat_1206900 [Sesamum alatum]|uniref:Uncharacterized protein n=1 Tax=Sesamum alatum TaxID=300844 RepID=A0AAE1YF97_9LAMI|nr:hypothetical protein Salat_1206900 [Sesamum alatum]